MIGLIVTRAELTWREGPMRPAEPLKRMVAYVSSGSQ
jgi:hypothetical protein